jgi:perosamine synthetase
MGPNDRHSWCFFPIFVTSRAALARDEVIDRLRGANIGTSVHYIPSHLFSSYAGPSYDLPHSEEAFEQLISLPLYPSMRDDDVEDVLDALTEIAVTVPTHAA